MDKELRGLIRLAHRTNDPADITDAGRAASRFINYEREKIYGQLVLVEDCELIPDPEALKFPKKKAKPLTLTEREKNLPAHEQGKALKRKQKQRDTQHIQTIQTVTNQLFKTLKFGQRVTFFYYLLEGAPILAKVRNRGVSTYTIVHQTHWKDWKSDRVDTELKGSLRGRLHITPKFETFSIREDYPDLIVVGENTSQEIYGKYKGLTVQDKHFRLKVERTWKDSNVFD